MKIIPQSYTILYPTTAADGLCIVRDIERAARVCYKSEDAITDTSYASLVKMLIAQGHHAMLEHGQDISVFFTTNRGVSHELVRHRLASYAQSSTRYCNYNREKFGNEITVIANSFLPDEALTTWVLAMQEAEAYYMMLINRGCSPQIARDVLPNALKTEIVVKANVREWRHIFALRTSTAAHPQMREIMTALRDELKTLVPIVFEDLTQIA